MREVRKSFGHVVALRDARLTAFPGEVHSVVGENGAGKTTLVNLLAGMLRPDAGEILIHGSPVRFGKPRDAWARGVGMVHQHFTLVPRLTVLENVALGIRSAAHGFRLPYPRLRQRLEELGAMTGLTVDQEARVEDLSVGERQRVEILKLLVRDPDVLIFDEPTAVLAPQEVAELIKMLRRLASMGRTVLLIAHKLDEVLEASDRITVLRSGETVHECRRAETDGGALTTAMVGREVRPQLRRGASPGPVVARLTSSGAIGTHGEVALTDVSLEIRRGEIVGIAGVDGNGQRELTEILAGVRSPDAGSVDLPVRVGFIPEDHGGEALVPDFDLSENLALGLMDTPDFRRGVLIRWGRIRSATAEMIERHGVRAAGPRSLARHLSGGNQQKVVVARELERGRDLLVARNPTRGLDVSAAAFVRSELARLRSEGVSGGSDDERPGIVLVSTDLDEILDLADRIFVLVRGRLLPVPAERSSRAEIGALMLAGATAPGGAGEGSRPTGA